MMLRPAQPAIVRAVLLLTEQGLSSWLLSRREALFSLPLPQIRLNAAQQYATPRSACLKLVLPQNIHISHQGLAGCSRQRIL